MTGYGLLLGQEACRTPLPPTQFFHAKCTVHRICKQPRPQGFSLKKGPGDEVDL